MAAATRRNAACSSASRVSSARLAVFEIAVATSSVNSASRSSMWSGRRSRSVESAEIAPHTSPSTMIGAPAHARIPVLRAASAIVPGRSAKSSIRAGRPVFRTWAQIVGPSSGQRVPAWNGCAC
jgi:hypothetical protein